MKLLMMNSAPWDGGGGDCSFEIKWYRSMERIQFRQEQVYFFDGNRALLIRTVMAFVGVR